MNIEALRLVMAQRGKSQSDIAKIAGVSRQAVSLWFLQGKDKPFINIQTSHLFELANSLNIKVDQLLKVPKIFSDEKRLEELRTSLNWDRRYNNLESFFCACVRSEPRALGRLVENFGLFASAKIIGKSIWNKFDRFKIWLHPVRRKECEIIWKLHKDLKLI